LYGSWARGDAHKHSDVDVLQVTPTHRAPYSIGNINITCYTWRQLVKLAESGSLFARHLVSEAIPLHDPRSLLQTLKSAYVAPSSYGNVYDAVNGSLPIVALGEDSYHQSTKYYAATAGFLLRTQVYARAFERGATSFSMQHISDVIGDSRPGERVRALCLDQTYANFRCVVDLLFEMTGTAPFVRQQPLEAFIVNSYGSCELAVILGLRILARGEIFTYAFGEAVE
jgi:hypothetical protein